jgi:hypothetical protein
MPPSQPANLSYVQFIRNRNPVIAPQAEQKNNLLLLFKLIIINTLVTKSKKTTKKTTSKCSNHECIKEVLSKDGKEFMTSCIDHIAKKVIASRDGSGWTPRGVADNLLQEGQKIFLSRSMNMINYAVKTLSMGKEKSKFINAIVTVDKETVLSSLSGNTSTTNITSSSPIKSSNEASTVLLMLKNISNTTASLDDSAPCPKTVAITSIQEFIDTN